MQQIFDFFSHGVSRLRGMNRRVLYGAIACIAVLLTIILFGLAFRLNKTESTPISIAVGVPLSEKESDAGTEILQSIQLYINEANQAGGVNGHLLKLIKFNDRGTAKGYESVALEAIKGPALVMLGNKSSELALEVSPIYRSNGMPLISTFTLDKLTLENPYYFRTVPMASTQTQVLSLYIRKVLNFKTVSIIQSKGKAYDKGVVKAFTTFFKANDGTIKHTWDVAAKSRKQSIQKIVGELAADPNSGPVILTTRDDDEAEDVVFAIRRAGLKTPLIASSQTLGREAFARRFANYGEEKKETGFFTNGMYLVSPVLLDSAGEDAQEFASQYQKLYGKLPSYIGIKYYEAAIAAVQALRNANLQLTPASRNHDREQVRNALAAISSRKVALSGLTGPLYFNASQSSDLPVRVAQFQNRRLISAPQQFETIFDPERLNVQRELKAGTIVQVGDVYFWRQNVVYTGIDINKLNRIDQQSSSFTADFYLWFRYAGDAGLEDIEFPGGINPLPKQPLFDPAKPIKSFQIGGVNYRLYQVRGEFKNSFDLHDYPFDRQKLIIRLQNQRTSSDRLIYAIDTFGLQLPRTNTDADRYSSSLWQYKGIQYAKETVRTTSTEGDPRLFDANNRVDYPGLSATITVQRRPLAVLAKSVPPLLLLALVPLMTLYFSEKIVKERASVTVAALISGTVLLANAYRQLPEVGYTVRIEYLYYAFFGLSLFSIWVAIIGDRLTLDGHKVIAKRLDWVARVLYVAAILGVGYWIAFGNRL